MKSGLDILICRAMPQFLISDTEAASWENSLQSKVSQTLKEATLAPSSSELPANLAGTKRLESYG